MQGQPTTATVVGIIRSDPGETPVVAVSGELDHDSASRLEEALTGVVTAQTHCVLLDLSELHDVDSGGIAVFARLVRRLEQKGWVGMVGVRERVKRVLIMTGLAAHPHIRFFDSLEDATCGLRPAGSPEAAEQNGRP